jgi:dGTPase
VFLANEDAILKGDFSEALLDHSRYKAQIDDIISESIQKIYRSHEVVEKEIAGYNILTTLLDAFTTACENHFNGKTTHFDTLILRGLDTPLPEEATTYEYLMFCCSYIAMLTDGNALQLFRKIKGDL